MIDTSDKIGRFRWMQKVEPPNYLRDIQRKREKARTRQLCKKIPYEVNPSCYVCEEDIPDVLRRHHLLLVSEYSHRPDINRHLLTLCECCHTLTHKIVYESGVDMFTEHKLKERGHWEKFVEIDRLAAKALIGVKYR